MVGLLVTSWEVSTVLTNLTSNCFFCVEFDKYYYYYYYFLLNINIKKKLIETDGDLMALLENNYLILSSALPEPCALQELYSTRHPFNVRLTILELVTLLSVIYCQLCYIFSELFVSTFSFIFIFSEGTYPLPKLYFSLFLSNKILYLHLLDRSKSTLNFYLTVSTQALNLSLLGKHDFLLESKMITFCFRTNNYCKHTENVLIEPKLICCLASSLH